MSAAVFDTGKRPKHDARLAAILGLRGTTASDAMMLAHDIEAALGSDAEVRRMILAFKAVAGTLAARVEGRDRRAKEDAPQRVEMRQGFGQCSPGCSVVPRHCTCRESFECTVCEAVKCEGSHD